ncbi:MAG: hypothetical protein ACR2PL_12125 [Dehalococcoidia bacterium]
MTQLEAGGQAELAEELLTLADELERTRERRDYQRARALMETLGALIYTQEG